MVMLLPPLSRMDGAFSDNPRMMGVFENRGLLGSYVTSSQTDISKRAAFFLLNMEGFFLSKLGPSFGLGVFWAFADFMRSFNVPFAVSTCLLLIFRFVG
ncbi:MAG: hypothetical protein CM15mP120_23110 [Pseudomonadota bacterium]|nr:MAG: hypothetical protein CM15mP120_23110 [Pseudomonadota bacterium]